jgi:hypothetical protein
MNRHHPYHPIVYVRGFAATQGEIEETVADPYMGFNLGSTKARTAWDGTLHRFYFESPLVRLMGDHGYDDVYRDGDDLAAASPAKAPIPYRSVVIYRYYDDASEAFGTGTTPAMERFADGLGELVLRLRDRVCAHRANRVRPEDFRVHLVAHSMGGLVCRAFLQNRKRGSDEARACVDRVFTYATPHRGVDLKLLGNVPAWMSFGDVNNFNHERMRAYLGLPKAADPALVEGFPADRVFNLVGTNPGDYGAAAGLSRWAAGDASDGLVRIANAVTHGRDAAGRPVRSPRAFVHRSHSGHLGIVNSEEGYQNLVRFLFGGVRVDAILDVDEVLLPDEVEKARLKGKEIRASYQFEVAASVRGCRWQMTRREVRENSAIFRAYDELFPKRPEGTRRPDRARSPHLCSVFLDPAKSVKRSGSVSLAVDLKVLVPDYEVDGLLFLDRHYEGGFVLRKQVVLEAVPDAKAPGGWRILWGSDDDTPGKAATPAATAPLPDGGGLSFSLPVEKPTRPGLRGTLRFEVRPWS